MTEIKRWRKNAFLTQAQMAQRLEIPQRTIESWEMGDRSPAPWAEKLIIEKLQQMTQQAMEERARKRANALKSDEDGNRPELTWVTIKRYNDDEFITRHKDMYEAMQQAEEDEQVALILVNKGTNDFYMDRNGEVFANYDYID